MNKKNIEEHLQQLQDLKGDNNWENIRKVEGNFKLHEIDYCNLGIKKIYHPLGNNSNINLQSSRGIGVYKEDTLESMLKKVEKDFSFKSLDYIRAAEFKQVTEHSQVDYTKAGFCEIGFRVPKLLNFYKKQGYKKVFGYDINSFNVKVGNYLGFDCRVLDLNNIDDSGTYDIDLSGVSHVVCYHVLEHLIDPALVLATIVNNMQYNTFLHLEIPLEGKVSNIKLGHLFPFKEGDIIKLLQPLGVQTYSTTTNDYFGTKTERIICRKKRK